ncbi:hypothetical protein LguiB_031038 [Lonicera macranthoides]
MRGNILKGIYVNNVYCLKSVRKGVWDNSSTSDTKTGFSTSFLNLRGYKLIYN